MRDYSAFAYGRFEDGRKEYDKMFMNNKVKVLINGKAYMPKNVFAHMCSGSGMTYDIDVVVNERYEVEFNNTPKIKDVIFNPPATIVLWEDQTKTVVKAQNGEVFDPEKGLAMAFFKKMHGNKGHYFEEIKKWTEPFEKRCEQKQPDENEVIVPNELKTGWALFVARRNAENEEDQGYRRYPTLYKSKSSAVRRAKKEAARYPFEIDWFVEYINNP